jgi:hypothetical protein
MLRPTVSRPVYLGIKHLSGALSLTRGRVCRLQLLLALVSAVILGSESSGTRDHILLSQIRNFPFRRLIRLSGLRWRYSHGPYRKHRFQQLLHCCIGILLSTGSVIVACLRSYCLATGVFAEPFPKNDCLCWLHSSCLEQICHNTYRASEWCDGAQARPKCWPPPHSESHTSI